MEYHLAKAQKEVAFLCLVIHKATAVNEWHGRILADIDKSCPQCGPQSVDSMKHMFLNRPLAQQVWRSTANILWQLVAKRGYFGPRKSFPMMQCLFDQPLCKIQKRFSRIWFFLKSGLMWIE